MIGRRSRIAAGAVLLLAAAWVAFPQQRDGPERRDEETPRIAVVLSGGGALGFAHIGVLEVLEEHGLPIDFVVGTSMGSVVAGMYAVGYTPAEMKRIVSEIDWADIFLNSPARSYQPYYERDVGLYNLTELAVEPGAIRLPEGITRGQKIANLLDLLTIGFADDRDFDQLPVPYRAVAVDLISRTAVTFDSGSLVDAMRASIAVPGAFTPLHRDGEVLVDGGVLNNLPVDVARNQGADIVIAVDLRQAPPSPDRLDQPLAIVGESLRIMADRLTEENRGLADLVISPDVTGFTYVDFEKGGELAAIGKQAAREMSGEIARVAEQFRAPGRPDARSEMGRGNELRSISISDVSVTGGSVRDNQALYRMLRFQIGAELDITELYRRTNAVFGLGRYKGISYALVDGSEGTVLRVELEPQESPSHRLRIGYRIESQFPTEDHVALSAELRLRDIPTRDSTLSFRLTGLDDKSIEAEYLKPLVSPLFLAAGAHASVAERALYEDGDRLSEFEIWSAGSSARVGVHLTRFGALYLAYDLRYVAASVSISRLPRYQSVSGLQSSLVGGLWVDSLDRVPYPTSGSLHGISYQLAAEWLGSDMAFNRLSMDHRVFVPIGARNTVGLRLRGGTSLDSELPIYNHFLLGGRASVPGLRERSLTGQHALHFGLEERFTLGQPFGELGGALHLITRGGVGGVWQELPASWERIREQLHYGASLGAGLESAFGAVEVTFGLTSTLKFAVHLMIGTGVAADGYDYR